MTAESRRTVCMRHHAPKSNATKRIVKLCQPDYQAIVLHPSLGCPLLIADKRKVSIILAGNAAFQQTFLSGAGNTRTGAENIKLVLAQCLKVMTWDDATKFNKDPALIPSLYKADRETAFKNITCTALGPIEIQLNNMAGEHFANIRGATQNTLHDIGMTHLYQVDLANLPDLQDDKMYDICWIGRNSRAVAHDFNETFLDPQDRMLRQQVMKSFYQYKNDGDGAPSEDPKYAYKVDPEKGIVFELDNSTPLLARHPIYIAPVGKDKLTIGHLSDIHVSSKHYTYKGKGATVIPGADATVSAPIGDMANNNGDNFFDLLNQIGKEADAVVITGDLYDHLHNYDPTKLASDKTGKLWEAMYLEETDDVHARNDEYPRGIDGLIVYSLVVDFYNRHRKPLFIISGNHEAYEYPYGISPRIMWPIGKVNEGIPLDHNLTFYEAILLYGPGYSNVLKKGNFDSDNFDWFYTMFTPLTDYWHTFGSQCLLGLGWGDGEDFYGSKARSGGTLPRATKSLNAHQKSLVTAALAQSKDTILCSHFTMVNYALEKPLAEEGDINIGTPRFTDYDHGSSTEDRETLYGHIINHPNVKLSLSGHSHRAGLYSFDLTKTAYRVEDHGTGLPQTVKVARGGKTKGIHPEDPRADSFASGKTRLLVSASTGPMPKQNLHGEMSGQGMEYPSGSKVDETGKITLVKVRIENYPAAKPRFCVACDYIDIMVGGFWESFRAVGNDGIFEMKPYWQKIHPKLSDDVKRRLIESVTLYLVGDPTETCSVQPTYSKNTLSFELGSELRELLKEDFSFSASFLSIKFNGDAVKWLDGFSHYNYDSPWNIQVGIYSDGHDLVENPEDSLQLGYDKDVIALSILEKKKQILERRRTSLGSWEIRRHEENGEIPDFRWRMYSYPSEYHNNVIKAKK